MKQYRLTIISKNKNSLKNFFKFLQKNLKTNFNLTYKYSIKKNKKTFLTILKSPHVNKTAQEQFESKYFSKTISIKTPKNFKFLLFLKKIKNNLFPDIYIKTKFLINKKQSEEISKNIFNPQKFRINSFKNIIFNNRKKNYFKPNKTKSFKNLTNFLHILSLYGSTQNMLFR